MNTRWIRKATGLSLGLLLGWAPLPTTAAPLDYLATDIRRSQVVAMTEIVATGAADHAGAARPLAIYKGRPAPFLDLYIVPAPAEPGCTRMAQFTRGERSMVLLRPVTGTPYYSLVCGARGKYRHMGPEGDTNGVDWIADERWPDYLSQAAAQDLEVETEHMRLYGPAFTGFAIRFSLLLLMFAVAVSRLTGLRPTLLPTGVLVGWFWALPWLLLHLSATMAPAFRMAAPARWLLLIPAQLTAGTDAGVAIATLLAPPVLVLFLLAAGTRLVRRWRRHPRLSFASLIKSHCKVGP